MFRFAVTACLLFGAVFAAACSASGEGGRPVQVIQGDDGCTPTSINAKPGEKLDLQVKNETGNTYEIEGIDGTNLEEVVVPEGRERSVGYNVPSDGGTHKVKCYVPGGVSTIIEIIAGGDGAVDEPTDDGNDGDNLDDFDSEVAVDLIEYTVTPSQASVPAGKVRFDATNTSKSMVHELAVLQVQDDGSLENFGEIEDIDPGASGSVVIDLAPGNYQLACLLVPGEADSTTDHYKEGMWTEFTVE